MCDESVEYDSKNGIVFFHGFKSSPLEKHLMVVSLSEPENVRQLTENGYSHSTEIFIVSTFSFLLPPSLNCLIITGA